MRVLKEIRTAVKNLNPEEMRATAERPLDIGLVASTDASYSAMEEFLLPPDKMSHLLSGEHRLFSLLSAAYEGLFGLPRADLQAYCGEREATCR